MSIEENIKLLEEMMAKVEGMEDILLGSVDKFGQAMTDFLDAFSSDLDSVLSNSFSGIGEDLKTEFSGATDALKSMFTKSLNMSEFKSSIKEACDKLEGANKFWSQTNVKDLPRKGYKSGKNMLVDMFAQVVGEDLDVYAKASQVSSMFRQIQGGRASDETQQIVKSQMFQLMKSGAGTPEDIMNSYMSAIQAGFDEKELKERGGLENMTLSTRLFQADKALGLGMGEAANMAGQMKEFSNNIDGSGALERIYQMSEAATASGVSFNKFSNAAMSISASLRPLGLDISETTEMLKGMSDVYKKSGMSSERAFDTAKNSLQALGSGISSMSLGAAAFFTEGVEGFGGKDATTRATDFKLLGQMMPDDEKRAQVTQDLLMNMLRTAQNQGKSIGDQRLILAKNLGGSLEAAQAVLNLGDALKAGTATQDEILSVQQTVTGVLKSDSENILASVQIQSAIKGLLRDLLIAVASGFSAMIGGIDGLGAIFSRKDEGLLGFNFAQRTKMMMSGLEATDNLLKSTTNMVDKIGAVTAQTAKNRSDVLTDEGLGTEDKGGVAKRTLEATKDGFSRLVEGVDKMNSNLENMNNKEKEGRRQKPVIVDENSALLGVD